MDTILKIRNLSKNFGGQRALDGVGFSVRAGEVHGLLGANGSGKSTIIKILAGYHIPEPGGELEVRGEVIPLPLAPGQFRALRMSFVHQDLGLFSALSVAENLRAGEIVSGGRWRISLAQERRHAQGLLERFDVAIDPAKCVGDLSREEQALVAIIRALYEIGADDRGSSGGLLILDEPTAFLPQTRTERLFKILRKMVAAGFSVLFVSHDLDEVRQITDRLTVLRDGRVHKTVVTAETGDDKLIEMIIGRRLEALGARQHPKAWDEDSWDEDSTEGAPIRISDLRGGIVEGVSFDVHRGEILGLTGLVGSSFEVLPYLLVGARAVDEGSLTIGKRVFDLTEMTPSEASCVGIALLPADRQRDGSVASLSILDNVMLPVVEEYFQAWLRRGRMRKDCARRLRNFEVRPPLPEMTYQALSGGNQQKALVARCLQKTPKLLILHEPTLGVDVGSRQQIFRLIRQIAVEGTCVICASSDHDQLALLCDRVLVFRHGVISRELTRKDVTKERITEQCFAV